MLGEATRLERRVYTIEDKITGWREQLTPVQRRALHHNRVRQRAHEEEDGSAQVASSRGRVRGVVPGGRGTIGIVCSLFVLPCFSCLS